MNDELLDNNENNIDLNVNGRKAIQFQLWEECNSGCVYCYEGEANRKTETPLKILVLERTLNLLRDKEYMKDYNVISYIGGEIYQGQLNDPTVRDLYFKCIEETRKWVDSGHVKSVWLCSSMMVGKCEDLYKTLDMFKDVEDCVWVATSYDYKFRFKTPKMKQTWEGHIAKIHKEYPKVKINTTMILTGELCDAYVDGRFSFNDYMDDHGSMVYIKLPCPFIKNKDRDNHDACHWESLDIEETNKVLPNWHPTKEQMLAFLVKYRTEYSEYFYNKLFSVNMRADTYYENRKVSKPMVNITRDKHGVKKGELHSKSLQCGHAEIYKVYCDCDGCALCDKISIGKLFV